MIEVTAPGKVLLLGGYAVLEGQRALSIAMLDRRRHGVDAKAVPSGRHMVASKDFGLEASPDLRRPHTCIAQAPKKHRVALAAHCAALSFLIAGGHEPAPLRIELANSPIFGSGDEKSGLGSSAAATVALISAVFEGNGLTVEGNREGIHKLSQLAHAIASERTGSGFDVATAAFGSIGYRRYDPSSIAKALEGAADADFGKRLAEAVSSEWPGMAIEPFRLEGFSLLVFNVKGARTSTVSSVKAVRRLAEYLPELYRNLILSQASGEEAAYGGLAKGDARAVREGIHQARTAQRRMTEWVRRVGMMSFDPIEPPALGRLIEEAEKADGVIAGRCPGSGGFDSVAFIAQGKEQDAAGAIAEAAAKAGVDIERLDAIPSDSGVRRTDKEVI